METKEIHNQNTNCQQPEDDGDLYRYHVFPWKPARQRSSSAKATALKTVRTACNRFQRARSSATPTLCKSSVGSSNCLLEISVNHLSNSVNCLTTRSPIPKGTSGLKRQTFLVIASLKDWFGSHPAEELTPKEIENFLAREADKGKWAP